MVDEPEWTFSIARAQSDVIVEDTQPGEDFEETQPAVAPADLVDSTAAASMLGITLNNLRQLTFRKKIEVAGRMGRRVAYRRSDVLALLEKKP